MNNETMTAEIVEGSEWWQQDYEHDQTEEYVRGGFLYICSKNENQRINLLLIKHLKQTVNKPIQDFELCRTAIVGYLPG